MLTHFRGWGGMPCRGPPWPAGCHEQRASFSPLPRAFAHAAHFSNQPPASNLTPPPSLLPLPDWLSRGTLQQVVLVIASRATRQVQERWAFDIQTDRDVITTQCVGGGAGRRGGAGESGGGGGVLRKRTGNRHASLQPRRACPCPWRRVFPDKPEAQITGEIQAIIRQITASITFLPLLSDACGCRGRRGLGADRLGRPPALGVLLTGPTACKVGTG